MGIFCNPQVGNPWLQPNGISLSVEILGLILDFIRDDIITNCIVLIYPNINKWQWSRVKCENDIMWTNSEVRNLQYYGSWNLFSNLVILDCSRNYLEYLPEGMNQITWLKCSRNQLHKLPKNFTNLEHLDCCDNKIIEFPNGMKNIIHLYCENNPITCLPYDMNILCYLHGFTSR